LLPRSHPAGELAATGHPCSPPSSSSSAPLYSNSCPTEFRRGPNRGDQAPASSSLRNDRPLDDGLLREQMTIV
jgi:hypothetical protein